MRTIIRKKHLFYAGEGENQSSGGARLLSNTCFVHSLFTHSNTLSQELNYLTETLEFVIINIVFWMWRHSQEVRQRSAKPSFPSSTLGVASKIKKYV